MEIILQKVIDVLGHEGDIINVTRGYARNYLIPKGLGIEATPQNLKAFELKKKKIEVKRLKAKEDALRLKQLVEGILIKFSHKAGEEGKLYGSITTMDIADRLEQEGILIDRRKIVLDRPIKTLGEFDVPVKLYPEVTGSLRVVVTQEEQDAE